MNIPFTITDTTISVFLNGRVRQVPRDDYRWEGLTDLLRMPEHNVEAITRIVDRATQFENITDTVTVEGGVVYFVGEPLHGALAERLIQLRDEGYDVTPWAKFAENLMRNPSHRSRTQLYGFLEKYDAPLTPDGHFIAFKGVRMDYKDHHTGTFDNSIGKVVEVDRYGVDDDPNNTCSSGLHACATEYLDAGMFSNARIVVLKINPADVVSIPTDYNFSKMRVCRYEVVDEVTKETMHDVWDQQVYEEEDDPWVDQGYYDWVEQDYITIKQWGEDHEWSDLWWCSCSVYLGYGNGVRTQYLHKDGTWHGYCGEAGAIGAGVDELPDAGKAHPASEVATHHGKAGRAAVHLVDLTHVLFNLNEFMYLD